MAARQALLAIPGVAQVSVIGGELPEYQVLVEQERLRLYDLTVQDVVAPHARANIDAVGLDGPYGELDVLGTQTAGEENGTVHRLHDLTTDVPIVCLTGLGFPPEGHHRIGRVEIPF